MTALIRANANVPPGFAPGRTDSAAPPQHLISPEAGDALRIVLVDDDDDFREAIGAELEDLGFRVTGLPDGPRAEERRVGKERVRTCRSRWSATHKKKQKRQYI